MVIGNFSPLDLRQDKGALWENFLISERRKQNLYKNTFAKMYFWRTKLQQEIDFVEVVDGQITGFEFKWIGKKPKFPQRFLETYNAKGHVIDRNNFREFVKL
jgi:predicted AAA+ superfamily ATPase